MSKLYPVTLSLLWGVTEAPCFNNVGMGVVGSCPMSHGYSGKDVTEPTTPILLKKILHSLVNIGHIGALD